MKERKTLMPLSTEALISTYSKYFINKISWSMKCMKDSRVHLVIHVNFIHVIKEILSKTTMNINIYLQNHKIFHKSGNVP